MRGLVVRAVVAEDRVHLSRDGAVQMTLTEWWAAKQEIDRMIREQQQPVPPGITLKESEIREARDGD